MGARGASATAVAAVLGGVLLITVLVAWAAAIGPGEVLHGDGPTALREQPTETPSPTETESPGAATAGLEENQPTHVKVMAAIAIGLQLLLLSVLMLGAYHGGRAAVDAVRRRRHRRPRAARPTPAGDVEFDALARPEELRRQLAEGAASQRDLLRSGTPRNAIVEVWSRFETLAAQVGATRARWETSSEFTLRVLEAVDADSVAVTRLAVLYREARFSDHELTEEHRATAVAALEVIHAGLTSARPGAAR